MTNMDSCVKFYLTTQSSIKNLPHPEVFSSAAPTLFVQTATKLEGRVPQYSVKIKDPVNRTTSVISVMAGSTKEANRLALKRARLLLGTHDLDLGDIVAYKPVA